MGIRQWRKIQLPASIRRMMQIRKHSILGNGLQRSISKAEKLVDYPSTFLGLQFLLGNETINFAALAKRLVGTGHPLIATSRDLVADEFYSSHMGGLWVLLVSKGTNPHHKLLDEKLGPINGNGILLKQRQLAGITETIRVAYLIHRGILAIDESEKISTSDAKTLKFGNNLAVLGGDYLLARACLDLAKLHNVDVVEQISTGLEQLFTGASLDLDQESRDVVGWEEYTLKCNGSLLAHSCQAAVMLSGQSKELQTDMYEFGQCIGMIQTLLTDVREFENEKSTLYKETNAVLSLELEANPAFRDSTSFSPSSSFRDIYQNTVKLTLEEHKETEMIERARNKLDQFLSRAKALTALFSDNETRTVVLDVLDNY